MKKLILHILEALIAIVCLATPAQIQMQVGANAGLSMYHENQSFNSSSQSTDTKTGFTAGLVIDIGVLNMLAIEPGLAYSMRGGQYSDSMRMEGLNNGAERNNLAYLSIPLHAKLKWPGIPFLRPYALAGVNLGILLSATSDGGNAPGDISSNINPLSLGVDFGAGLDFDLPGIVPYIEYVYNFGLSELYKNTITPFGTMDVSNKTSGFELKAGIRIKL